MSTDKKTNDSIQTIYDKIDEMAELDNYGGGGSDEASVNSKDVLEDITKAVKKLQKHQPGKNGLDKLKEVANEAKGKDDMTSKSKGKDGETVLHRAVAKLSFKDETHKEVIRILVKKFPELAEEKRPNCREFSGQTPVHMAITKGVVSVVKLLLTPDTGVLRTKATGHAFHNTVMMGELPLFVAALKNDNRENAQKMVKTLLGYWEYGAVLDARNSRGDNVCHSLIRYAYLYPDKLEDVLAMLCYVNSDESLADVPANRKQAAKNLQKKIWYMKNDEGLIPLQLAAQFGQHEIFKYIMELPGYCYRNDSAGLFDVKIYDVTEVDAIAYEDPDEPKQSPGEVEKASRKNAQANPNKNKPSILRRMLELDPKCAFQFIAFTPVRRIIDEKWNAYRCLFYPWFCFHVVFMGVLTWYATERSLQNMANGTYFGEPDFVYPFFNHAFSLAFGIINIFVGIAYLADAFVRFCLQRMPVTCASFVNPYSNVAFRAFFLVFGLSLIIDFICAASSSLYENYMLMLAVLIGWFLMLFFLRAFRPFSFFTIMIQNVLLGDLLRFSVIILCELIAFSTLMFMTIQGASEADSEYSNYIRVFLSMFKLMVGLGDVGLIYQTRHPALAVLILVAFIILTTLLMINSLIAMISRTSTELVEGTEVGSARDLHWKLQRLSLVLYMESILPRRLIHIGGKVDPDKKWYSNRSNNRITMTRYSLEIKSLQDADDAGGSDNDGLLQTKWGLNTVTKTFLENMPGLSAKVVHRDKSTTTYENDIAQPITPKSITSYLDLYNHDICDNCDSVNS